MEAEPRLRIAVTPEGQLDNEGRLITEMLDSGRFTDVHLRHPGATLREMTALIESVDLRHHSRLHLHGHFDLINDFNLGGLHLNRRCPAPPPGYTGLLSASCHSIDDLRRCASAKIAYATLSPIFDSLSKPGYRSAFSDSELRRLDSVTGIDIVALGGITRDNLSLLYPYNFTGYAMLTAAWTNI